MKLPWKKAPETPPFRVLYLYALTAGSHRSVRVDYWNRTAQEFRDAVERDRKADRMITVNGDKGTISFPARSVFHIEIGPVEEKGA